MNTLTVDAQVDAGMVRLRTDAFVRLVDGMHLEMALKVSHLPVPISARRTLVWLFTGVHKFVIHRGLTVEEGPEARARFRASVRAMTAETRR